jgi:hypothetical protein
VISSRGSSPFRLNFDGTFTTSGSAAPSKIGNIELKEAPLDAASIRFLEKTRARQKELKK